MRRGSPFPGMDPYLERVWSDVHSSMSTYAREDVQRQLGDDLVARSESHVFVAEFADEEIANLRTFTPDAHVSQLPSSDAFDGGVAVAEPIVAAEPLVFEVKDQVVRQRYIEIVDHRAGGRVVTVIELTSPANKRAGEGRDAYRQKQDECRQAGVNLVEIDLTRAGQRTLAVDDWPQSRRHASTFAVSVWRAEKPKRCALYAIRLQDRLPTIRIPLRAGEADVTLALQPLIERAYASGRYDKIIDYSKPPEPPLSDADAAWANALLSAPPPPPAVPAGPAAS